MPAWGTLSITQSNYGPWVWAVEDRRKKYSQKRGPPRPPHNSTTSFRDIATLIYALGAGISAAAGTRLAVRSFLANVFALSSFQFQNDR